MSDEELMWMVLNTCIVYADYKATEELVPVFEEMYDEYTERSNEHERVRNASN